MRREPPFAGGQRRAPRARFVRPQLEVLEDRVMLSADPAGGLAGFATPGVEVVSQAAPSPLSQPCRFRPAQIRQAYGFNNITFNGGSVHGDGTGQTIAIVDAYNQPNIVSDLAMFNRTYGLPAANLTVVNQNGGTSLPAADQGWGLEISLDV